MIASVFLGVLLLSVYGCVEGDHGGSNGDVKVIKVPAMDQSSEKLSSVRFTLPGWTEEGIQDDLRLWRDPDGAVLSLAVEGDSIELLGASDVSELRQQCRELAEGQGCGLIEVRFLGPPLERAVGLIYKRLERPAYVYTGMAIVPAAEGCQVWTIVAGEIGMTGVREAVITTELMNSGELTLEDYETSWACDPYDPSYDGVDRSVLRFLSDDERYDERFPNHPLSKVRRFFNALLQSVDEAP